MELVRAMVIMPLVIGGCGASRHGEPLPRMVGTGAVRLVSDRVPEGYESVLGEDEKRGRQIYLQLSTVSERAGRRGIEPGRPGMVVTGAGGGLSVGMGERRPLALAVVGGCSDGREHAFVYGVLRDAQDTISARDNGASVVFGRAAIPASLGATGVIVYTVLKSGPFDVVVRAPDGRILAREHHFGNVGCHGPSVGS